MRGWPLYSFAAVLIPSTDMHQHQQDQRDWIEGKIKAEFFDEWIDC
jgi:hypothetical protein